MSDLAHESGSEERGEEQGEAGQSERRSPGTAGAGKWHGRRPRRGHRPHGGMPHGRNSLRAHEHRRPRRDQDGSGGATARCNWRQERQRVHVEAPPLVAPHAEVQMRRLHRAATGRADFAHPVAGPHVVAARDRHAAQVQVARAVAVDGPHRDGQAGRSELTRKRHHALTRRGDLRPHRGADVDPAMHSTRVRARVVVPIRGEHGAAHGPHPSLARAVRVCRGEGEHEYRESRGGACAPEGPP
jgi:hypothetical protein